MKSADISDAHVVDLAAQWQRDPMGQPGVVAALVREGIPSKLALHKVARLVDRGLLDYGTSPNYAWPRV